MSEGQFYIHYHVPLDVVGGNISYGHQDVLAKQWDVASHLNVTPGLNKAIRELNIFREENNYVSPCQERPELFDVRPESTPKKVTELPKRYAERVRAASELCLSQCRAFVPCLNIVARLSVSDAEPPVCGVVAGTLLDPTSSGDVARKVIEGNIV